MVFSWPAGGCQQSDALDSDKKEIAKVQSEPKFYLTGIGPLLPTEKEFVYEIDARFQADVTRSDLKTMRLVTDFDERIDAEKIVEVLFTSVTVINDDYKDVKQAIGKTNAFTQEQIELLESVPYSTDLRIRMDYMENTSYFDTPQRNYTTPHLTIIPEKQAAYETGKSQLISYLKNNSSVEVAKAQGYAIEPGKVRFTISESGVIKDVRLISTCGHKSVDEKMLELIKHAPGKWSPAEDVNGNKVEEQLVFYFGTMGC